MKLYVNNINKQVVISSENTSKLSILTTRHRAPPGLDDGLPVGQRAVVVVDAELRAQAAAPRAHLPLGLLPRARGRRAGDRQRAGRARGRGHQQRVLE